MLNLNDREWKVFALLDVFTIASTSSSIDKTKLVNEDGRYPYVTRTDEDNGISSFVHVQQGYKTDKGNCITVGLDTQTVFYQQTGFYTGQNIQVLRSEKLNKTNALFLIPLLKGVLSSFYWGSHGATLTRLKRSKILLPTDTRGQPDYVFMEQFIKEREQKKIQAYAAYVDKMASHSEEVMPLNEKKWSPFVIGDLFTVEIGKAIDGNKINKTSGKSAYITRRESNNGVDGFIDYEDRSYRNEKFPVISIGNETANPYVQGYPFYTGTKVNILCPKMPLSKYTLLFVVQSLRMLKNKYSYSFTVNSSRLKRQIVLLPVNASGQPDWDYMEQYVKQKIYAIQRHYLQKKLEEF